VRPVDTTPDSDETQRPHSTATFAEPRRRKGTCVPEVPFEIIDTRRSGSCKLPAGVYAVRHQSELETIWARLYERHSEPPSLPVIAWSDSIALFVLLGVRPTSGYEVRIEHITATRTGITVEALETTPRPLRAVATALTAPHQMVTVPRIDGAAVLSMRKQVGS
jgi:hypothetical protein